MKLRWLLTIFTLLPLSSSVSFAIEKAVAYPNSEPFYVQLRHIQPSGDAYEIRNVKIVRDAGTLELQSGTICLLAPVNGVVTGAVFRGSGTFTLASNDPRERAQMKLLTKGPGIEENFEKLVLRFADGTADELSRSMTTKSSAGCATDVLEDNQKYFRVDLRYNVAARLLQPVMAAKPDGFFEAFFYGKKYGKLDFTVDPTGVENPEEVALNNYNDSKWGVWYSGHLLTEPRDGWRVKQTTHETGFIKAVSHKIDATIEKNGLLTATTTETFVSQVDDLWVVPFDLFHKLRVSAVTDAAGTPLSWIQERYDEDSAYFAVLRNPVKKGDTFAVTTTYSGKDAVRDEGGGNYYVVGPARVNWYPNTRFGDFAMYDMTLRVPKHLTMAATGNLLSQHDEGNQSVTQWKSTVPLTVAGFNFGDFKSETYKLEKQGVQVTAFANNSVPDIFSEVKRQTETSGLRLTGGMEIPSLAAIGSLETTPLLKKSLAEAQLAVQLYTDYFGPMPYSTLQVTQQTAGNFGQAWPGLVFLPIYYFLDTQQRHQLRVDFNPGLQEYWRVVEPHEVAHEWWGHSVGFTSYRDQWMSEGFADFSASLFIQLIRKDRAEYLEFWRQQHERLVTPDQFGHRPIDVGSVTMGYRVSTGKVGGWTGQNVLYPKGAFILHMLRQMMYTQQKGDADFKAMMQDLVQTYRNKPVSTEDFKGMVEKHMTPVMDIGGNHKMDWFFDEWVYGTEIPSYSTESTTETAADGTSITLKVTQSGVSPNFRMVVPVYFELNDGKVGKLGQLLLVGNTTITQKVPCKSTVPKRLLVNYNYDVLTAN